MAACCVAAESARAQSADRLEIGAQVTAMRLSGIDAADAGVGGRIAWRLTDALAFEAVSDFFPTGRYVVARGGRKFHALFGPKIGRRAARVGVFAKTRVGVARVGEGRQVGACILIYPPPEGCYAGETRLAFDFGGGVEVYPYARSGLRVDVGSLVTRLGASSARFGRRGDFAHDLQVAAGFGLRF